LSELLWLTLAITVLPVITLTVFIFGFAVRFAKWFMEWKVAPVMGKPTTVRGSRLRSVVENWTLNLLPPRDLAARTDLPFYMVGVTMHLSFILLLFTMAHQLVFLNYIGSVIPISGYTSVFIPKPISHIISIIFICSLSIMITRRVFQYLTKRHLRAISSIGDFIAAPLLWIIGLTGFLAAISPNLWPNPADMINMIIITVHLVTVQLFIMYIPFSKFIHGATALIVRTLFGIRRGRYGV